MLIAARAAEFTWKCECGALTGGRYIHEVRWYSWSSAMGPLVIWSALEQCCRDFYRDLRRFPGNRRFLDFGPGDLSFAGLVSLGVKFWSS